MVTISSQVDARRAQITAEYQWPRATLWTIVWALVGGRARQHDHDHDNPDHIIETVIEIVENLSSHIIDISDAISVKMDAPWKQSVGDISDKAQ